MRKYVSPFLCGPYYPRKSGLERVGFRLRKPLALLAVESSWHVFPLSFSLCSGVWLESVSQWGRNQRASLEAGGAGHPGPTAPGPVGREPRVQRGSATTPSKAWHGLLSFLCTCWDTVLEWQDTTLEGVWEKLDQFPKAKRPRRFTRGEKRTSVSVWFYLALES